MSLTIDEAIARFEANAEQNKRWANGGLNPEVNAEYAAEHKQLVAWLRELAERRKAPEIIRCSECIYRYVEGNHVRFNRCELNHNNVQSDDWYCADAERRADD